MADIDAQLRQELTADLTAIRNNSRSTKGSPKARLCANVGRAEIALNRLAIAGTTDPAEIEALRAQLAQALSDAEAAAAADAAEDAAYETAIADRNEALSAAQTLLTASQNALNAALARIAELEGSEPPPPPPPPPSTGTSAEIRPFDPAHPVYVPMPANAPAYKDSAAIVGLIVSSKRSMAFDTGSESPPVYVGQATDQLYRIGSYSVHVPATAKAGTGSDYPLVILDAATKTEYRMWQATINHSTKVITYNGLGVGRYANDGSVVGGKRALGQAEISGQNTGSGCSYTVGMVRPHEIARGRIDHAIRVAIGYPRNNAWFWPALRTENQGYATSGLDHAPMGARIAIRSDFDLAPLEAYIDSQLSNSLASGAVKTVLRALKEFGMVALDGTTGSHNLYFEGPSADWGAVMGPKNSYGSYNDLARVLVASLNLNNNAGWRAMFVADPSVFDGYAR